MVNNVTPKVGDLAKQRIFYMIKKEDVPLEQQPYIIHLKCNSVRRIDGISILLAYLDTHKGNHLHQTEPYLLKRITWNEAVDMFGLDTDTETSDANLSDANSN
jgi:hypothetical protein